MKKSLKNIVFITLSAVMLLIGLYWFLTSIVLLSGASVLTLFILSLITLLVIKFPIIQFLFSKVSKYKLVVVLIITIYQIALLYSTNLMIRSDAAMVFKGAMKLIDNETISLYLSRYPNNLLLFLYERFFYNLFGMRAIWVLQALNIFYSNFSLILLYKVAKKFFNENSANIFFIFYVFFISMTAQSLTVYTDIMVLPIIAIQLYLIFSIFSDTVRIKRNYYLKIFFLGFISSIGVLIRPTLIILVIATFLIYFLSKNFKKVLSIFLIFIVSFSSCFALLKTVQIHQKEVKVKEEYSISALAYIDLGLTYIGTNQQEFQEGLSLFVNKDTKVDENYDGRFSNDVVLKDIKRRLKEYTPSTFLGHILYKQSATMRDGTLGWNYKDSSKEGVFFINPLYEKNKNNKITEFIRNYLIYTDRPEFGYYKFVSQFIYCILILGFIIQFVRVDLNSRAQLLSLGVFGGLLFLMIFEGGKTRYLIQFLPQILILSSLGFTKLIDSFFIKEGEYE